MGEQSFHLTYCKKCNHIVFYKRNLNIARITMFDTKLNTQIDAPILNDNMLCNVWTAVTDVA